jgi:tRNA A37 threonylcarbamoyladenosine dehydratase
MDWLERTALLLKEDKLNRLQNSHVLVVGLGGVGSFAAEFLVRSGIGELTIIDGDTIDKTNINRQLPALHSTIGKPKTTVVAERLLDINPDLKLHIIDRFLEPDDFDELLHKMSYDYVVDAIDSVSPKIYLILAAKRQKIKIVSAMGAGGKTDPSKVKVADISKTRDDFLARVIRKRLRKHGIQKGVKCVFSTELQQADSLQMTDNTNFKKSHYGTISYMPALFGLQAAATVINYLTKS